MHGSFSSALQSQQIRAQYINKKKEGNSSLLEVAKSQEFDKQIVLHP